MRAAPPSMECCTAWSCRPSSGSSTDITTSGARRCSSSVSFSDSFAVGYWRAGTMSVVQRFGGALNRERSW